MPPLAARSLYNRPIVRCRSFSRRAFSFVIEESDIDWLSQQGAWSSVYIIKESVNFSFSVRMAARARRTAAEIAQLLIANVDSDESGRK